MVWLWTWGGKSFGYRDGDELFTHDGRHVGRFYGDDIHDRHGVYIGEVKNSNRLIKSKSGKSIRRSSFSPYAKRIRHVQHVGHVGNVTLSGYEDFPLPENL